MPNAPTANAKPRRPRRARAGAVLATVALALGTVGCATEQATAPGEDPPAGETPAEGDAARQWDPSALARLDAVAVRAAESPVGCENYGPHPVEEILLSFEKARVEPVPVASAECDTAEGGTLFLEAFESPEDASAFMESKAELLCERGAEIEGFPGLPVVDGGDWIVEPDDDLVASQLAEALGVPWFNACDART